MRPWVVICSRDGAVPQAVGTFASEQAANDYVNRVWRQWPQWAFSVSVLQDEPGTPLEWPRVHLPRPTAVRDAR